MRPTPSDALPSQVWRVNAVGSVGLSVGTRPAFSASSVAALAPSGLLVSLNRQNGSVIWTSTRRGGGRTQPSRLLMAQNRVLWPGDEINAFDATTGAIAWSYSAASSAAGCDPSVSRDLFIVCTDDWSVIALRATDGAALWTRQLRDSLGGLPRLVATAASGDTVYAVFEQIFSTTNGGAVVLVFGLDQRTGTVLFKLQEGDYTNFDGNTSTPTIVGDLLIIPHGLTNKLTAINRFTKQVVWRFRGEVGWTGFNGPLAVADGIVYASSGDRRVYAITVSNGALVWKSDILEGSQSFAGVCGPYVISATEENVRVLNRATGSYLGFLDPGSNRTAPPSIDGNEAFAQGIADFRLFSCTQ
jgi:outer membrane protein assembly factor BamB